MIRETIAGSESRGVAVQLVGRSPACSLTGEVCNRAKTNAPKGLSKTFKEHLSLDGEMEQILG